MKTDALAPIVEEILYCFLFKNNKDWNEKREIAPKKTVLNFTLQFYKSSANQTLTNVNKIDFQKR